MRMLKTQRALEILWCRMTRNHRGHVFVTADLRPFWMCDNCGETVR